MTDDPARPVPHDSARGHATGEALYVDDLPAQGGELFVDFVGAPCARGRLLSIDAAAALDLPDVEAVLTARDIAGHNAFGAIFRDEPFLVEDEISYLRQPVAVVAARSPEAARGARRAVVVEVAEEPPILTIEQAIEEAWFLGERRFIRRGDFAAAWETAPHRLEGTLRLNGQEQLYFESQAAIAYPGEEGQILVHSSTQNPTEIQAVIAEVLGLGHHRVVCVCKRMGGAFGGKETQAAIPALMAALVAQRTGRAARVVWGKDDDMRVTGKRHPYRIDYRVGFDDDGRLLAVRFVLHSNGGAFADLSTAVLERSMLHADNGYFLADVEIEAQVCRTNLPPNTAFRGFGGPQAVAAIETVLEEVAHRLGRDSLDVRRTNLYGEAPRDTTPYGQVVSRNLLPEIVDRLEESSDYRRRRREIAAFNAGSATELRGLAMTTVKFGISFTTKYLNQGNALVNLYSDGTVQVSTGATEMGQGVNTKIAQLVAEELGTDVGSVTVMPTSTEKNANTSPTAASASTDLNGTAAVRAAAAIRGRLADFAAGLLTDAERGLAPSPAHVRFVSGRIFDERAPERSIPLPELAGRARRERVDLGARGYYATPGVDFNRSTGKGTPFYYFTTGAAVAEVLVDRLTGELRVARFDALMDIGRVLNSGIDRGQLIGGIVQGIGWVTTEELVYGERGELLSTSPTTYKIPNVTDLPAVFRAELLPNDLNTHNVRASKAVGEPPLMLGVAVFAAVRNALSHLGAARVPLDLPATQEAILTAVERLSESAGAAEPALTAQRRLSGAAS
jgi:xanthine dehydrogenase large subunit